MTFLSMDEIVIGGWHPWMERPHSWMTSTDEDDRWRTWSEPLIFGWLRINVMHEINLQWLPKSCFNSSREFNRWWGLNSVPHNENIKNDFFMLFMAPAGLLLSTVFWSLKFGCKFDFFGRFCLKSTLLVALVWDLGSMNYLYYLRYVVSQY